MVKHIRGPAPSLVSILMSQMPVEAVTTKYCILSDEGEKSDIGPPVVGMLDGFWIMTTENIYEQLVFCFMFECESPSTSLFEHFLLFCCETPEIFCRQQN